jgi:hypothetical protein
MKQPVDLIEEAMRPMAHALEQYANTPGNKVDSVSTIAPAIYSAAISLKRIADAGDRIASALERFDFWEGSLCVRDTSGR